MLKKLELAWKRFWLALICGSVRLLTAPKPVPEWGRDPCRVLLLRPDRIGDAIVTTGLIREITTQAPNVTLDVLCTPRNQPLLANDPHVRKLHVFDRKRWSSYASLIRSLRAERYDGVMDCMVTAPSMTTMLLMLASGARHRIGIAGRGVDAALTVHVPPNSEGRHIIDLLAAFGSVFGIDVPSTDWSPRLTVDDDARERALATWNDDAAGGALRILVNVSAGKVIRDWPEDRFAAAIGHIRSKTPRSEILVIGAPSEWERVERIGRMAGVRPVRTPQLSDVVALVATAGFLLTPDTSVGHMASAFATPAVIMYLRGVSRLWGLYGTPGVGLETEGETLMELPLEPVLAAIDQVMRAIPATV